MMRRLWFVVLGFALAFCAAMAAVGAALLFAVAVGGHLLAARDRDAARMISFDPSSVATLVPIPAAASLILSVVFLVVYLVVRRGDQRRATSARR